MSTPISPAFGEIVRECRKRLGLSQVALADRLGLGKLAVMKWEGGASLPSSRTLDGFRTMLEGHGESCRDLLDRLNREVQPREVGRPSLKETLVPRLRLLEHLLDRCRGWAQPDQGSDLAFWMLVVLALWRRGKAGHEGAYHPFQSPSDVHWGSLVMGRSLAPSLRDAPDQMGRVLREAACQIVAESGKAVSGFGMRDARPSLIAVAWQDDFARLLAPLVEVLHDLKPSVDSEGRLTSVFEDLAACAETPGGVRRNGPPDEVVEVIWRVFHPDYACRVVDPFHESRVLWPAGRRQQVEYVVPTSAVGSVRQQSSSRSLMAEVMALRLAFSGRQPGMAGVIRIADTGDSAGVAEPLREALKLSGLDIVAVLPCALENGKDGQAPLAHRAVQQLSLLVDAMGEGRRAAILCPGEIGTHEFAHGIRQALVGMRRLARLVFLPPIPLAAAGPSRKSGSEAEAGAESGAAVEGEAGAGAACAGGRTLLLVIERSPSRDAVQVMDLTPYDWPGIRQALGDGWPAARRGGFADDAWRVLVEKGTVRVPAQRLVTRTWEPEGLLGDGDRTVRPPRMELGRMDLRRTLALARALEVLREPDESPGRYLRTLQACLEGVVDGLPSGWSVRSLGSFTTLYAGQSPDDSEPAFWLDEGGYPFWGVADLALGGRLRGAVRRVSELARLEVFERDPWPRGTVFMSARHPVGRCTQVEEPAYCSESVVAIQLSAEAPVSAEYLMAYLPVLPYPRLVLGMHRAASPLTIEALEALPVLVPSRDALEGMTRDLLRIARHRAAAELLARELRTPENNLLGELLVRDQLSPRRRPLEE